jgi:hypothetical protein
MSNNTGGPAFPIEINSEMTCLGMTLRDYFAAKAMQEYVGVITQEQGARKAYEWADAMLKARER